MIWLEDKFVNAANLDGIKLVRNQPDTVYNLPCAVCGDHASGRKKKAYIFQSDDHFHYHCHLCGYSAPFTAFLRRYNETLYHEYVYEKLVSEGREPRSKQREQVSLPFKSFEEQIEKRAGRTMLDELFERCDTLPAKHAVIKYLNSRKIPEEHWNSLWFTEDSESLEAICPEKTFEGGARLILPAFHPDGSLIAVTGRAIYDGEFTRYLEAKVPCDHPVVFGWDKVDFTKRVFVTEGPIDRMFLPNALAAGGSDLQRIGAILPKDKGVMIFDNQPRTIEIVKLIEKTIEAGFAICIWPERMVEKDINDLVLAGKDPVEIIEANIFRGLAARVRLAKWRRV